MFCSEVKAVYRDSESEVLHDLGELLFSPRTNSLPSCFHHDYSELFVLLYAA